MDVRDINEMKFLMNHNSFHKDTVYKRLEVVRRKIYYGELKAIIDIDSMSHERKLNYGKSSHLISRPYLLYSKNDFMTNLRRANRIIKAFCRVRYEKLADMYEDEKLL